MKVLIVGGGGREHALAWACSNSPGVEGVLCAPGNGGTEEIATNVALDPTDARSVALLASERHVDLVIIGPDAALAAGVADACTAAGIAVFGPTAAAARIETSKEFAKEVMADAGVPTASWVAGSRHDHARLMEFVSDREGFCVVKADGLALGKGVTVCSDVETAQHAIKECLEHSRFGEAGARVIVEQRLHGREVSVFAVCDGKRSLLLPLACDYKRAYDGDRGPNTGGMGAYSPPMEVDIAGVTRFAQDSVIDPVLDVLATRDRTPFVGCLYAGLMLTDDGIKVLEFNARFGDPETQVVLPRLDHTVLEVFNAAARGSIEGVNEPSVLHPAAVTVVLAQEEYPGGSPKERPLRIPSALPPNVTVFHAGTVRNAEGDLTMTGGRVLNLTGVGSDVESARAAAYDGIGVINAEHVRWRTDIAKSV